MSPCGVSTDKLLPSTVKVQASSEAVDTGLMKLGALIGDHAQVGCNVVLNPGERNKAHV
jgi:UDP-N-acetylglucosamine diphosphorylase / glucose-1-phosphate thymidylyltransferase / UDP-N-acetylgalactosamine diphosphorylase / glucosamine-1-phosphate N-acetyltransferase / galactosamine-1-phosphate N-acetyltransferase